ncbi:MAG TPA: acetate/propionate family kinase [Jatrophihabitans sp.]|nr:acetate/propionate family kinase [Jatrophihabitans sp.]
MRVLVVNAGSSSVKLRLLDAADQLHGSADLPADAGGFDADALADALAPWPRPDIVAHRIVHGGTEFTGPVRLDDDVTAKLRELTVLAPLHQPKSLAALAAVQRVLPQVPGVACFDTAFHATLSAAAATYAVPREWRERHGVRRYGFHGLSHGYAARRVGELLPDARRVVTCHLGAGASLCAVRDGRSVDTTMGFTPLEGLVMATRSGTVDPGLVLWLEEHEQLAPHEVATALEERSGLAALAGTPDMREIVSRAGAGDADAQLGLDVYLHRLAGSVAAMAASAGGLDVLVFTGGVGERSAYVRAGAADRLGWLGVRVDARRNDTAGSEGVTDITEADAPVRMLVLEAREDLQIAHQVRALLAT